jgi:hypothetical protein
MLYVNLAERLRRERGKERRQLLSQWEPVEATAAGCLLAIQGRRQTQLRIHLI